MAHANMLLFLSGVLALVLSEAKVIDLSTGQPATSLHKGKKCVYSASNAHPKNGNDGKLTNSHPNTYHSCCVKGGSGPIIYTVKLKSGTKNPLVHFHTRKCCNNNFGYTVWFYLSDSPTSFGKDNSFCKELKTKDNGNYNFNCKGQGKYIHVVARRGVNSKSTYCLDFAEVIVKGIPFKPPAGIDLSTGQPATSLHKGKKCVYSNSNAHPKNGNDGKLTNSHPSTYHSCCVKGGSGPIIYTVKLKSATKNPKVHFHTRKCCNNNFGYTVWFYLSDSPTNFGKDNSFCKELKTKDNGNYDFNCNGQGKYIHVVARRGVNSKSTYCLDFAEVIVREGTPTKPKPTKPKPPALQWSTAVTDLSTGQPATSLHKGKTCVHNKNNAQPKNGNDGKLTNSHPSTYHSCCVKGGSGPIIYTVKLKSATKNPKVHFHTRKCCNNNFGYTVWFYLSDSPTSFGKDNSFCKELKTKDNGNYDFNCNGQGKYIHVVARRGVKTTSTYCLDFAEVIVKGPKPVKGKPAVKPVASGPAMCSNAKWKVKSLAPVKQRSGFPATNAFDGKSVKDAGKSFISMASKDLTFVIDLGKTETFNMARFYGVNDGDQAEHAVILCGNVPSGKGKKGVAAVNIPRKPVWVNSPKFKCTNRYVTFYVRDAHSHSSNIRLSEIQLYGCTVKCKCENGTPTTGPGPRCPKAGLNRCRSCNKGFTLDPKTSGCVKNTRLGQCSKKSPLPKLDMKKTRKGVHVKGNDAILTLGTKNDVALVRTGEKSASLVGDITVRGRLMVNCEDIGDKFESITQSFNYQIDDLTDQVYKLKAELAELKK